MSDGSREALAVLGLLPVWRLRPAFQPAVPAAAQGAEGSAPSQPEQFRFVVMAASQQTQTLWRQIVLATRGMSPLHQILSEAEILTMAQRDQLQTLLHSSPSGTSFYCVADVDLADDFVALAGEAPQWVVSPIGSLSQLIEGAEQKRQFWAQLVALNRSLSGERSESV